jgi:two-component system, NtrC family, sensor histidine kinase KinB
MTLSLRRRLVLTILPSLVLPATLGAIGIVLLGRVSRRIDDILHENYDSVVFMVGLNEALERIDSSFNYALLGRERKAKEDYDRNWVEYERNLAGEGRNITIFPEEPILFERLTNLTAQYRAQGDEFFTPGRSQAQRSVDYLRRQERPEGPEKPGLLQRFEEIKQVAKDIRELNQKNMEDARDDARRTAAAAQYWFGGGLVLAALLAGLLAWSTTRAILRPIRSVTDSAVAIGLGELNQAVPVLSHDELGRLAEAFNRMARQLHLYRQSHSARLQRAQRTAQAAIDAFPDPVLVVGPEGQVEMANPAARHLLGVLPPAPGEDGAPVWQPPGALRQPVQDALHKQLPFLTQAYDQTVTFRLGGEDRAYLPQVLPIADPYGNTLGAAVVLTDVTRFRLLDQIKSDLVATVSHELKTPLTSVRLVLHLLLEETVGPLTPKQAELLVDARDNAERLLNMIEHLLALARLEQGRESLRLQPEAPQALLQVAAEAALPRAEAKHVELAVEDASALPPVAVDPERFGHALNNLLDNALTYTEAGGKVTLSAAAADGKVSFTVRDTGVGIPAEFLPYVFEKFFRVPDQSRGHGTGLGLAIVREILTAHHGQVSCESEPGRGTAFHLTVPVWQEAPQPVARAT